LFRVVLRLGRPVGFAEAYFEVRPWKAMERSFRDVSMEEHYGGMLYLATGTAP